MKEKDLPSISDSEWKVMDILWAESPKTSHEIVELLSENNWSPKTIKTLIFRLEKKGVISHKKIRREHLYYPLYSKDPFVKKESRSVIDKLFGGSTVPMVAHFLEHEKLSKEDIVEIKKIIDSMAD